MHFAVYFFIKREDYTRCLSMKDIKGYVTVYTIITLLATLSHSSLIYARFFKVRYLPEVADSNAQKKEQEQIEMVAIITSNFR